MQSNKIPYLIKTVNDKLKVRADESLKEHDLTFTQSRVLRFIKFNGGSATQKEIGEELKVSHPTVVGLVARLREKGFVTCTRDHRVRTVMLTDKVRALEDEIQRFVLEGQQELFKSFSDDEIAQLESMLQRLYENLS